MTENKVHLDNYEGTKTTKAQNQNMEFVNDTLQLAEDKKAIRNADKDDQPR
jgi:hypothetical protein